MRNLYPDIDAYDSGFLAVDARHKLYFEQCGNPQGKPVVMLHGGPGAGCSAKMRRFHDPAQYRIYMEACELASRNGSTYFIFDRDEVTLSACCRLRTTIYDNRMLRHPESMRFCGFQNVTINIPQAAYVFSDRVDTRLERAMHGDSSGVRGAAWLF